MKIDEIVVKDRVRKNAYAHIKDLMEDIQKNGLINPITINADKVLLAGFRRYTACKALNWTDIPVHMVNTRDEEQDLQVEISENELGEDFTMTERLDYARRLERIESEKAKGRMSDGGKGRQNSDNLRTDETVAQKTGIGSRDTLRKAQEIAENKDKFDPEEFKDWDDGKLSTNKLYTQLKQQKSALSKENQMLKEDHQRLEQQNSKLKHELESQPVKKVVQTVEKLVTPDDYEFLKKDNVRLYNENKKHIEEAQEWERKYKESGRITPTLDEKAKKDMDWLTIGIQEFLRTYGGKAWGLDRRESIDQYHTEDLAAQAKNLLAFAQNLYSIVTDAGEKS